MSLNLFSTFPKFVDEELNRRRTGSANPSEGEVAPYQNGKPAGIQKPKSPWMRMISGYENENGKRMVLMGGDLETKEQIKFGFENLYEKEASTGERYRPKPSINSIQIDEKLESFECTVEWTVHSLEQLERLHPYFMNLGTSVVVDWGWNTVPSQAIIDAESDTELQKQFASLNEKMDGCGVKSANSNISPSAKSRFDHPKYCRLKKGKGKYSLAAGAITNFSFSPDDNGSYSCTTEIVSLSKAMNKLRTKKQETKKQNEKEDQPKPDRKTKKTLYDYLQEDFTKKLDSFASNSIRDVVSVAAGPETSYSEAIEANKGYYVSWKKIEELVNTYATAVKNEGNENEIRNLKMDSADSVISSYNSSKKIGNKPLQLRTLQPLTCIVDVGGQNGSFRTFHKVSEDGVGPTLDQGKIKQKTQGVLYNLYVQFQFFKDAIKNHESIIPALKYILRQCSSACFDIWDFKFLIDSNRVQVIDRNTSYESSVENVLENQGEEFDFRPNTRQSIMRSFSFDTNLDDRIKGQVVVQSNSDFGGISSNSAQNARIDSTGQFYTGKPGTESKSSLTDRIIGGFKKPENDEKKKDLEVLIKEEGFSAMTSANAEAENDTISASTEDHEESRKEKGKIQTTTTETLKYLVYSEGGDGARKEFRRFLQGFTNEKSPTNANNIIGVNAQIELDGIGGFSAFQVIDIKQIPKVYENGGVFSIESVTHSVSTDDWSTELKTKFIVTNGE